MQPLILLAIVGVAAVALGAGSLTNVINLTVQDFGVGDATINTPATAADVNFHIGQLLTHTVLYNVVDECTIAANDYLATDSTVFCKLTDANGNIAAEGHKVLGAAVSTGVGITVPITNLANPNAPFSNNVQNIHDVMVVIQGP